MPASLPNLEEVIVTAKQDSLLKLEDFEAGFTTQETIYALGEGAAVQDAARSCEARAMHRGYRRRHQRRAKSRAIASPST